MAKSYDFWGEHVFKIPNNVTTFDYNINFEILLSDCKFEELILAPINIMLIKNAFKRIHKVVSVMKCRCERPSQELFYFQSLLTGCSMCLIVIY